MPGFIAGQRGFTLIELIVVIVLLGIMSFGTTQFIVNSSQSYVDTARRDQKGSTARIAVEKIARELRNALPNSARVSGPGQCLEFIPVLGGSIYTELPLLAPATSFSTVPFVSSAAPSVNRVAVYPVDPDEIYTPSTSSSSASSVSPKVITSQADLEDTVEVAVQFDRAHQFPLGSPSQRWYMIGDPVSFCLNADNQLFRYGNYGFIDSQPVPGGFGAGKEAVPNRSLIASGITGAFNLVPATLQRNALVQISLSVPDGIESLTISHEVQLRNVP